MRIPIYCLAIIGVSAMSLVGCSTAPQSDQGKADLNNHTAASLDDFKSQDPTLGDFMKNAYGYAIFPSIGKGAVGVGGAYGKGQVYEQNRQVGYADMTQGTVGVALGGQTYSELIVFENADALHRFESGEFTFAADASAVALKSGGSANAKFQNGIAVFVNTNGGLMADAAIGGQKFSYQPL